MISCGLVYFSYFERFFAALVAIFAKVGLQGVDSSVATAVRTIVTAVFIIGFVIAFGKSSQLTQLTSQGYIFHSAFWNSWPSILATIFCCSKIS